MIHPSGIFDCVATVPNWSGDGPFSCATRSRVPIVQTGTVLQRVVGPASELRVTDAGLTPDASPTRPRVLRSCLTLTAPNHSGGTNTTATFHVDRALIGSVRSGDEVHISRTANAAIGLSILRDGELLAAVGAITAVPLGRGIAASIPRDLIEAAEAVFRQRAPAFAFRELPLEVTVHGKHSVFFQGGGSIGAYAVSVSRGCYPHGEPSIQESAAIWNTRLCPDVVAVASAMLMDRQGPP